MVLSNQRRERPSCGFSYIPRSTCVQDLVDNDAEIRVLNSHSHYQNSFPSFPSASFVSPTKETQIILILIVSILISVVILIITTIIIIFIIISTPIGTTKTTIIIILILILILILIIIIIPPRKRRRKKRSIILSLPYTSLT